MTTQNIKFTGGIITTIFLLYFVLTKYFGLIHIENKSLLGWLLFTSLWIIVLLIIFYSKFIEKNKFLIWSENKRDIIFYVKTIIGLFAIVVLFGIIKTQLGMNESVDEIAKNEKFWNDNLLLFIYMGLTAGFAEELLFRGYILPRLEIITNNKWLSIISSSVLFSIAHFANSDINKLFFLFGFGMIFSIHYHKYRNILVLGITHCLTDIISL